MQKLTASGWVRPIWRTALLEAVVVGGTSLAALNHRPAIGIVGVAALVIAGGAYVVSSRWPLIAVIAALAGVVTWYGADLPPQTSISIGLVVVLYAAADPARPRRTAAIGAASIVGVIAAQTFGQNHGTFQLWSIDMALWLASPTVAGYLIKERQAARAEKERRAHEEHVQRRVTEERLRIARELHDVVSHSISVINVQAGVAAHLMSEQPELAHDALLTIKSTSRDVLRELRGILGVLRDIDEAEPRAPTPGIAQLPVLVEMTSRAELPTEIRIDGDRWPLPPAADLAAYRVVQEALTNTLRHARASAASIDVRYGDRAVTIEVRDDGAGEGVTETVGAGQGLVGLRERVSAVGGALETGPCATGGYRVWARLPRDGSPA
ncbi:MAG: histidine kinase [Candidatus Dormiibacterota bacterium]